MLRYAVFKPVRDLLSKFRQDSMVDSAIQKEESASMQERWQLEEYSEEEEKMINIMYEKFERKARAGNLLKSNKWKVLSSPDAFVKMESINEEGSSAAIGKAVTTVDASIFDCAVWEMDKNSRRNYKSDVAEGLTLERHLLRLNR